MPPSALLRDLWAAAYLQRLRERPRPFLCGWCLSWAPALDDRGLCGACAQTSGRR